MLLLLMTGVQWLYGIQPANDIRPSKINQPEHES